MVGRTLCWLLLIALLGLAGCAEEDKHVAAPDPSATIHVLVSPDSAVVGVNQQVQLTATVEGAADSSVDWFVNGDPGGSAVLGTITAAGLYYAPNSLTDPPEIEIRAVSRQAPTRYGVAAVTIVPRLSFEAEAYTAARDKGGIAIGPVDKSAYNASGGLAVEGLDRLLEWIDVPIELPYSGTYEIAFRHASDSSVKAKISMGDAGPEGQSYEWIVKLNAGGCG